MAVFQYKGDKPDVIQSALASRILSIIESQIEILKKIDISTIVLFPEGTKLTEVTYEEAKREKNYHL